MSARLRVAITDYLENPDVEREVLNDLADVEAWVANDEKAILQRGESVNALLVCHDIQLTVRTFSRFPECRVIVRLGVGFDNVDLRAAGERGIVVCNVPDYGTEDVADHALMTMLALMRRLIPTHLRIVEGGWDPQPAFTAPRMRGRVVGVIGSGRIGTAFVLRAKALGMRVIIYDPFQPRGYEKAIGVERANSLKELLPKCEVVSLHCPLTETTYQIINEETLRQFAPGAYLINTARGGCVDLSALHDALESGHVGGAALDVTEPEPLTHEGIRRHPNVILTPHTAYCSVEGMRELRVKGSEEVARALRGERVWNPVNLEYLQHPRCPT